MLLHPNLKEFTEELFLELITMKSFDLQNGEKAQNYRIDKFKDFMSNYFIDNPNLSEKTFNILIKYLKKSGNFRHNTDQILQSEFCTEDIFNYALDEEFLGTDKKTLYSLFANVKLSEKTLLKYLTFMVDGRLWTTLIKTQKLSKKVIDYILENSQNKQEDMISLAQYNYDIDENVFMSMLNHIDLSDSFTFIDERALVIAIKKMILKDRNFYETPYNWNIITNVLDELDTEFKVIVYSAIITYENINFNVMDDICQEEYAMEYIIEKMDLNKIPDSTKSELYDRTGKEEFLPDEAKDIFLF